MRRSIVNKIMTLTLSSFIIKVLGFVFRIYLSNRIGAEGMGLYQLILSVYALGATISTSGISTAISRLTAIYEKNAKKILKTGIIITQLISFGVAFAIWFNAEYIGTNFIKDIRTVSSVKTVALSFPPIALFACLSGYFNGLSRVKYPMRGQIAEQIARIVFIFALISKAMENGIEAALKITSWGIVIGEYLSAIYLYKKYRQNLKRDGAVYTNRGFLKAILKISIPISANGYFQSFLRTAESIIIPGKFILYGYTHKEALSFLGMIKGMAMPLIFFPAVMLSSVSVVSLPHISKAQSKKDSEGIKRAVKKSLILALFTGISVMILFFTLSDKICLIIYKSTEVSETLRSLSVLVPVMYINIVVTGILNGLGKQLFLLVAGIVSSAVKILMICIFIPAYGFQGYILSIMICEAFMTVSTLARLFTAVRK